MRRENKSVTHQSIFALQAVQMQTGNVTSTEETYTGFKHKPNIWGLQKGIS